MLSNSTRFRRAARAASLILCALLIGSLIPSMVPPASAAGSTTGVFFGTYGGSESSQMVTNLKNVGVKSTQMEIWWSSLEPDLATNLSTTAIGDAIFGYEARLQTMIDAGITPIILVNNAPSWAAIRARGPLISGMEPAFARFMQKMIRRWGVAPYNVNHWVLWAEPDAGNSNTVSYRLSWGDSAAGFVTMLQSAYPAIKQVDSDSVVMFGSLAYDNFRNSNGSGGPFVQSFLDNILQLGAGNYFDWLAFNSYSYFAYYWEERQPGKYDIAAKAAALRAKLSQYGVSKPLVALEAGIWSCCGPNSPNQFKQPYFMPNGQLGDIEPDETVQAQYLPKVYARGLASDLQGVFWFWVNDYEPATTFLTPDYHRGWYRYGDLSAKPSATAMRVLTQKLAGATYAGEYTPAVTVSGRVEAYRFTKTDGTTVVMLWSPYGTVETATVEVDTNGGTVTDYLGATVSTQSVGNGRVRLTVSYGPVYIAAGAATPPSTCGSTTPGTPLAAQAPGTTRTFIPVGLRSCGA